jgi:hypothetical protein
LVRGTNGFEGEGEVAFGNGEAVGGGGIFGVVVAIEALSEFSDLDADGGVDTGIVVLRFVHDVPADGILLQRAAAAGDVGFGEVAEEAPESFGSSKAFASEDPLESGLKFGIVDVLR